MIYIYGLRCPVSGEIRYIGKSTQPHKRLKAHLGAAKRCEYDHHTARWIRSVGDGAIALEILDTLDAGSDWQERERHWIAAAECMGWPLTNSTAGGEGLDYRDADALAKYRVNLCAAMKATWGTREGREKNRMRAVALHADPEISQRHRMSLKAAYARPEVKAAQAEITRRSWANQSTAAARAAGNAQHWKEHRAERLAALNTTEAKAKHRAARKASWADPIVGAKLRAQAASPERRAKLSAKAIERATPEYRAAQAERTRLSWIKRREKSS